MREIRLLGFGVRQGLMKWYLSAKASKLKLFCRGWLIEGYLNLSLSDLGLIAERLVKD
jgi:hypothetical protein